MNTNPAAILTARIVNDGFTTNMHVAVYDQATTFVATACIAELPVQHWLLLLIL